MLAVSQVCYLLEWKWRIKKKVVQTAYTRASYKSQSCEELLFAHNDHNFIQSKALGFMDGDCPDQFQRELQM